MVIYVNFHACSSVHYSHNESLIQGNMTYGTTVFHVLNVSLRNVLFDWMLNEVTNLFSSICKQGSDNVFI